MILNNSSTNKNKAQHKQQSQLFDKTVVFLLTFSAYAGLHAVRVGWSYSNPQMEKQNQQTINSKFISLVNTLYLIFYSIGMATVGNFNKNIPLNWFIAGGMIISCLFYISIALYHMIFGYNSQVFILVVMCLNGFFQSAGWPSIIAVMGNWFGKNKKGLLMGIWAINSNIGNIVGQVMCNIFEENQHFSWEYNFYGTGILTLIIAFSILFFLKPKPLNPTQLIEEQLCIQDCPPTDVSLQSEHKDNISNSSSSSIEQKPSHKKEQKENMNLFSALKLPRVPHYVVGYACLKGCIYGLLFWLPQYLQDQFEEQKGYMASMVDLGSFLGGLIVGYLGDKYTYRSLFLSPFLFLSASIMFVVSFMLTNVAWTYYIALLGIGICLGGPYNIIRSAITIDLGLQAKSENIFAVAALIEGCASFLAAISQLFIPLLPQSTIFYLFCSQCALAGFCLFPLFLQDIKQIKNKAVE